MNERNTKARSLESITSTQGLLNWADCMWEDSGDKPVVVRQGTFDTWCRIYVLALQAQSLNPKMGIATIEIEFSRGLLILVNKNYGR